MIVRRVEALSLVLCSLLIAVIACATNAQNMTVQGTPEYICPSSTPRPTNVMPPPNPPTYPPLLNANVDYYYIDPTRSVIHLQYAAQSIGWVQLRYWGTDNVGGYWSGSGGTVSVAYAPFGAPGVVGSYAVFIPDNITSATIAVVGGSSFPITRYVSPVGSNPIGAPSGLPAPIYPTPRPTFTPYPTPTMFVMAQDYYLDDPVYTYAGQIRIRLRMHSPILTQSFPILPLFTAASWELEITNFGPLEFDFLGGLETYVSEVQTRQGAIQDGIWSPSHLAAQFLGIVESAYYPRAIAPGETVTVRVAAWIHAASQVSKVSLILDTPASGDPGYATFTPGKGHLATWRNQINSVCRGEIRYP